MRRVSVAVSVIRVARIMPSSIFLCLAKNPVR
jgi:hypothetical protein